MSARTTCVLRSGSWLARLVAATYAEEQQHHLGQVQHHDDRLAQVVGHGARDIGGDLEWQRTGFNDLFLLHVASFSTGLAALGATLTSLDRTTLTVRLGPKTGIRTVAGS